jgi:anhydro-N-acetylmuramic acid kinase
MHEDTFAVTSTLQIGEPSIIAERTGVTTVADFRPRDMAAGGQGAPFAPYAHYVLFRHPEHNRIITNIGGISNITFLPATAGSAAASPEDVVAFDTGPGNMIIDALMSQYSGGEQPYDDEGSLASRGTYSEALLDWMLTHPYLQRRPPKSTGREEFGADFVRHLCERTNGLQLGKLDIIATATVFTAKTIAQSCKRWLPLTQQTSSQEMFCCGGGVKNRTLMAALQHECHPIPVKTVEQLGISSDALEAITFALLARATLEGIPLYFPRVTGAKRPVLLGKIIPGRRMQDIWKYR